MNKITSIQSSRTYNSIWNSVVGIVSSLVTILLNFVVRIIIVKFLGEEINGIHNLFLSITNVVALIEAGFSSAMVIHLYKPIKVEDHDATKALMSFYKKIYAKIALIYTLICVFINIFGIQYLVKSSIPIRQLRIYFAIYTLITLFDYLTYHKTSMLYAEQKNRVRFAVATASQIVFRSLQIVFVIVLKEYCIFLVLLILEKVTTNIICGKYVDKRHNYIKGNNSIPLSGETKSSIYRTVKAIFVNNIASNVQVSAKSILISMFNSVSVVGYFGNYNLVIATAQLLFSQFGSAFTSSFGNLAVEGDKEQMYQAYRKTAFILDLIAIIFCAGFICCIQTLILVFFGDKFLLNLSTVIILTIGMFIYLLNVPIISIQNALGLHNKDQIIMVVQAIAAVMLGLVFAKKSGVNGMLLGLLLPQFTCTLINKGVMIYKVVFHRSAVSFMRFLCYEIFKGLFVISSSYFISSFIYTGSLFVDLVLKALVALVISFSLLLLLSFRTQYLKDTAAVIKNVMRRKPV